MTPAEWDKFERKGRKAERMMRRTPWFVGALLVWTVGTAIPAFLTLHSFAERSVLAGNWFNMGLWGLLAIICSRGYARLIGHNNELWDVIRRQQEALDHAAVMMEGTQPFLRAIHEAHVRGVSVVIPPPDGDDAPAAPEAPPSPSKMN